MYVMCGMLTEAEVIDYTERMLCDVEAEITARDHRYVQGCRFIVNMPGTKIANYVPKHGSAHAFVWFSRKEVFHMLSGRDYDGESIFSPLGDDTKGVPVSDVLLTDWSETVRTRKLYCTPDNVSDGDEKHKPEYSPAVVERQDGEVQGTLFCVTTLPDAVTDADLAEIFTPFVTQGQLEITRTAGGNAYIMFSHTDDAYFALVMTKKYYFAAAKTMLDFRQSCRRTPRFRPSQHGDDRSKRGRDGRDGRDGRSGRGGRGVRR